jgi:hypothetical protein
MTLIASPCRAACGFALADWPIMVKLRGSKSRELDHAAF